MPKICQGELTSLKLKPLRSKSLRMNNDNCIQEIGYFSPTLFPFSRFVGGGSTRPPRGEEASARAS